MLLVRCSDLRVLIRVLKENCVCLYIWMNVGVVAAEEGLG